MKVGIDVCALHAYWKHLCHLRNSLNLTKLESFDTFKTDIMFIDIAIVADSMALVS